MRYAECDACGRSLIGSWHINITRVTKPKGKHRNQKRTTINRLCGKCWTELKQYLPEKPAVKTETPTEDEEYGDPPCSICGGVFHRRAIAYEMLWELEELAVICPECFKQISEENIEELNPRSIIKVLLDKSGSEELEVIYGVSRDLLHKEHEEKYGTGMCVEKVVQLEQTE